MMKLDIYNKKRNFKKTPEPKGKVSSKYKNLFIIQKHAASHLHYDFRLELNGVLLSWAVPKGPCLDPTVKRLAVHVEDHPVEYGGFEGIIPKGEYGGGTVMLWDKGKWIPEDENITAAYHKGHLRFQLKGEKLKGGWNLIRFKKDDEKSWFLIKAKDKYARQLNEFDITVEKPVSVISHYDMDEITNNYENIWSKKGLIKAPKKNSVSKKAKTKIKINLPVSKMPKTIFPELATLVDKAPDGNEWLHELKFDGYRILAFKQGKNITLMSRNNRDWTPHFENVVKAIKKLSITNAIFDGELVLLDENHRSNFQLLQNSIATSDKKDFIYYIFDLIYYDKYNLMSLPLIERKNILQQILVTDKSVLRLSDHIIGSGPKIFKKLCEMALEGIVSKEIQSNYEEKRSKSWLKVKCSHRQEFVIGGYSPPKGARKYFGSLYLGYFDKNKNFKFCGNVGTGFNQASIKDIYDKLQKYKTNVNPFTSKPPGVTSAIWVKPSLIAEVEFSEWTSEGSLRHPSFKGLRTDKPAKSITREKEIGIEKIKAKKKTKSENQKVDFPFKLTHPNKILYSEGKITKLDIATYYNEIQEWILPYIINRPLTIVRCPDSYQKCFYQKHINKSTPSSLYGISIKEKDKTEKCIYIKNLDGLMSLVQMGTLEIHPWGSRIEKVEFPDMITIDLDPSPEVAWKKVVTAAKRIKENLATYKLKSFVKTTGGKGLHVVIPIKPEYEWSAIKNFVHVFVKFLVTAYPDQYVSEMSKAKRKGKIFIDYLRNQRGATAIAAYSTRAREHAPVSVPLAWDELTENREDYFYTIATLPSRLQNLKTDPWQDFFKIKQSLRLDKL